LNIQIINFLSFTLLVLGIFGAAYSRRFLSIMISFQLIIISALLNFYSFSLFLYESSTWDKTFILLAFMSIYLVAFSIVFYNYSRQTGVYELDVKEDMRLFKFEKADWWGEDSTDDN
jgi:NADH:ubiquinone oxidoreductase subunit K